MACHKAFGDRRPGGGACLVGYGALSTSVKTLSTLISSPFLIGGGVWRSWLVGAVVRAVRLGVGSPYTPPGGRRTNR